MVSSVSNEEDTWDLLEEFKAWTISGKYDAVEFQKAISSLRMECQVNIRSLEKEIECIHRTLEQNRLHQSQYLSIH